MKWVIPKQPFELGIEEYYVIVWITEKEEYATFIENYSKYME